MSSSENTQLSPVMGYDPKKQMIFSAPDLGTVPGSTPKIEFRRINISTLNEDGTVGELVFPTERVFSFGVSENIEQGTGKITGYTFPLVLWSKDQPTEAEKTWTDTFDKVVDCCIDHLVDNREEIDQYDLERS